MACNVFGIPITNETLKGMVEYHDKKKIGRKDRARVAFEMKNAEGKDANARKFVENLREKYAEDCILCLIYNATGDSVVLDTYKHGDGSLAPSPYPVVIANGQWGAYLKQIGNSKYKDGAGAVVYVAKNADGLERQLVFVYAAVEPGRCSTEIRPPKYYPKPGKGFDQYGELLNSELTHAFKATNEGFATFASIGGTTKSPVFEGIMTLEGAWACDQS